MQRLNDQDSRQKPESLSRSIVAVGLRVVPMSPFNSSSIRPTRSRFVNCFSITSVAPSLKARRRISSRAAGIMTRTGVSTSYSRIRRNSEKLLTSGCDASISRQLTFGSRVLISCSNDCASRYVATEIPYVPSSAVSASPIALSESRRDTILCCNL